MNSFCLSFFFLNLAVENEEDCFPELLLSIDFICGLFEVISVALFLSSST